VVKDFIHNPYLQNRRYYSKYADCYQTLWRQLSCVYSSELYSS